MISRFLSDLMNLLLLTTKKLITAVIPMHPTIKTTVAAVVSASSTGILVKSSLSAAKLSSLYPIDVEIAHFDRSFIPWHVRIFPLWCLKEKYKESKQ
jgi:hypothetical protein